MKMYRRSRCCKFLGVVALPLSVGTFASLENTAQAQIIPDETLGSEGSVVTPLNEQAERIDGGAARGSNLFHSFQEFNIAEGRGAYFANPAVIENIFSRVTGSNPSHLLGTLGVLGDANLFFLNPNGIIFGKNASLDIRGSLVTSTANSLLFPDGNQFSATNPQAPPLLDIDVPVPIGLQFEGDETGAIINAGELEAGGNLTLVGGTVASTGQLSGSEGEVAVSTVLGVEAEGNMAAVQLGKGGQILEQEMQPLAGGSSQTETSALAWSELVADGGEETGLTVNDEGKVELTQSDITVSPGDITINQLIAQEARLSTTENLTLVESQLGTVGDLTLLAQDTVRVRDSVENPFIAAAGGELLLQGNRGVDIFALNHPDSGLFSGGDLVLRSANTLEGDAHYFAGGSFRIEQLNGSPGDWLSPFDPIVRTSGDVSFDSYEGASLHILAGGSVTITGNVRITGTDAPANSIRENVTLSDGTEVPINGSTEPTLDIRAGTTAFGTPEITGNTAGFSPVPGAGNSGTGANITIIGDIFNWSGEDTNSGRILLTNQYSRNAVSTGTIETGLISTYGDVTIDSRSDIITTGNIDTSTTVDDQISGSITLLATNGGIGLGGDLLSNVGFNLDPDNPPTITGVGGDITLVAAGDIQPRDVIATSNNSTVDEFNTIRIESTQGSVALNQGRISTTNFGTEFAGDIILDVREQLSLDQSTISSDGNLGRIEIATENFSLTNGSQLTTSSFGQGNAGIIIINATDTVSFDGSFASSTVGEDAVGNGGSIDIQARSLSLSNSAEITSSNSGQGDAGSIEVKATDTISLTSNSQITSNVGNSEGVSAVGKVGNISLEAREVALTDGAQIEAGFFSNARGETGIISIKAEDSISFEGNSTAILSNSAAEAVGNSSNIELSAQSISLSDGAFLNASNAGEGDAGNIQINATDSFSVTGGSVIQAVSFASSTGNAGNITIDAENAPVSFEGIKTDGVLNTTAATITAGTGKGGDINIKARSLFMTNGATFFTSTLGQENAGKVTINAKDSVELIGGNIFSNVGAGAFGNGGNIDITARSLSLSNSAELTSSSSGQGDAGSIEVKATDTISLTSNSKITSNVGNSDGVSAVGKVGNISLEAREVALTDGGQIEAGFFSNARGETGSIEISTDKLSLINGASLSTTSWGQGNAGNIEVKATDTISLTSNSKITSNVGNSDGVSAVGKVGNISLEAREVALTDGGQIQSGILSGGQGTGGKVNIDVREEVSFSGFFEDSEGNISPSGILTDVESGAIGNGGDVNITARSLSLIDGAQLITSTFGQGNAGNVKIDVTDKISFEGATGNFPSRILSNLGSDNGFKAGDISITANSLSLNNGAQIQSGILSGGRGTGGKVNIDVREEVSFSGFFEDSEGNISPSGILTDVESGAIGNGGSIDIQARSLSLIDGAQLITSTFGQGNAGNLMINATDTVSFDGSFASGTVGEDAVGNGGSIDITARSLSLIDGAQLSSSTFGQGNAGSVIINATDTVSLVNGSGIDAFTLGKGDGGKVTIWSGNSVTLSGVLPPSDGGISSRVVTSAEEERSGQGGPIFINTPHLQILDGAVISARSRSERRGGIIEVNAETLELRGGGQMLTTTFRGGNAGSIDINVSDRIEISGSDPTFSERFNQVAEDLGEETARFNIDPVSSESGLFANTEKDSRGNGGSIFIDPRTVIIQDDASIAVNSDGKGIGGNIDIVSGSLTLDNGAEITAETFSTQGGNITLQIDEEPLLLRRKSSISATAGTAQAGGDGGNIIINAPFIIAFPNEDSDITANAFRGNGGNIDIATNAIFGIEFRDEPTPLSDFTVSSELGIDGNFALDDSGIDPTRGLIILPEETVNTEISQGCQTVRGKEAVEYFEIGRGGLPPNPDEPLNADTVLEDWIDLEPKSENDSDSATNIHSPHSAKTQLISPCPAQ